MKIAIFALALVATLGLATATPQRCPEVILDDIRLPDGCMITAVDDHGIVTAETCDVSPHNEMLRFLKSLPKGCTSESFVWEGYPITIICLDSSAVAPR